MSVTDIIIILKQIESLGYLCVARDEGGWLALLAEPVVSIDPLKAKEPRRFRQMVRIDRADEDARYRAACQLAVQCCIELE